MISSFCLDHIAPQHRLHTLVFLTSFLRNIFAVAKLLVGDAGTQDMFLNYCKLVLLLGKWGLERAKSWDTGQFQTKRLLEFKWLSSARKFRSKSTTSSWGSRAHPWPTAPFLRHHEASGKAVHAHAIYYMKYWRYMYNTDQYWLLRHRALQEFPTSVAVVESNGDFLTYLVPRKIRHHLVHILYFTCFYFAINWRGRWVFL